MHTRFVGLAVRAVTVAAALTGMVTWAPVANAAEPGLGTGELACSGVAYSRPSPAGNRAE